MNTQNEFNAPTLNYIAQIEEGLGDYYYIEAKVEVDEESEIQNIDEVDESNKWSSIKNLYGVLGVEWVLFGVGCAIISMNPLMIAFAQQNSLRFKCLYLAACLCMQKSLT